MSSSPYHVEITETAREFFDAVAPQDQAEIAECFETLSRQPFPGPGSSVVRLRTTSPTPTPLFYVFVKRHGILFSIDGELVEILVIYERPTLR